MSIRDYIVLNKHKVVRSFTWNFVFALIIIAIWALYKYYFEDYSFYTGLLFWFFIILLIVPPFFVITEIVEGYVGYRRAEKLFDNYPIRVLLDKGFKKSWKYTEGKWHYNELILSGVFKNYSFLLEIQKDKLAVIAKADIEHLDDWEFDDTTSVLSKYPGLTVFLYVDDGISINMKVKALKQITQTSFIYQMDEFVRLLQDFKVE